MPVATELSGVIASRQGKRRKYDNVSCGLQQNPLHQGGDALITGRFPRCCLRAPYTCGRKKLGRTQTGRYRTSSRQQHDSSRRPARVSGVGLARGRRQQTGTASAGPGRAGGEPRRGATARHPAGGAPRPIRCHQRIDWGVGWSIVGTLRIAQMSLRATICRDSLRRRFLRLRSPAFTNPINSGRFRPAASVRLPLPLCGVRLD